MELEVRIARLGAQGDGVADGPDGPLFVPFALAGERVKVEATPGSDRAVLIEVLEPSPDRVAPVCPHFGVCGGCALQHLEASAYLAWKRELVVAALRSRGLDAEVDAVRPVPLGSRRRSRACAWPRQRGARSRLSPRPLARADRHRYLPDPVAAHRRAPAQAETGARRRFWAASARRG